MHLQKLAFRFYVKTEGIIKITLEQILAMYDFVNVETN